MTEPQPNGSPVLEASELVSGYGRIETLHGVDVSVPSTGITTVVGPNGSGKSTLLKTIVGLIRPWKGSVRFEGREVAGKTPHELTRMGMCMVPQGRVVFPDLTVEENLRISAFTVRDQAVIRERIDAAYELLPVLGERRRQPANQLSGGEQVMLALGKVVMLRPRLLLLDEPSLGLAPKVVDLVYERIVRLSTAGTATMVVEQNVRKGLAVADHAIVLVLGTIRFAGHPRRLESEVDLGRLFLEGEQPLEPAR